MVDNYTATGLVIDLHNTPRYDWTFRRVEFNTPFTPDDSEYQKSLSMITFAIAVFGCIMVVFGCVLVCPRILQNKQKDKNQGPRDISKFQRAIIAFLVFAILIFLQITAGINLLSNAVDGMHAKVDFESSRFGDVETRTDDIIASLNASLGLIRGLNVTGPNDLKMTFEREIDNCYSNVSSFRQDHMSANYNATGFDRIVDEWQNYMVYGSVGLTVLLVIPMVIMFGGICAHSSGLLKIAARSMMGFLFLAIVVGAAEFAGSVAIADFCMDPNNATVRYMTEYVGHDNEVLSYFVNCPEGVNSPLAKYFTSTEEAFNVANQTWDELVKCDCVEPPEQLTTIYIQITNARQYLSDVESESKCTFFHDEFIGTVKQGCNNGLTALVLLFTGHFFIGVFFLAIAAIASILWPEYATAKSSYQGINDEDSNAWAQHKDSITAQQWYDGQGQQIIDTEWNSRNENEDDQRQTRYRETFGSNVEAQGRPGSAPSQRMHNGQIGVMSDI